MFSKLKSRLSPSFKATGPVEYIVAGLGNPGKEYENTRHNVGFIAMDYISKKEYIDLKKLKFKSLCGEGTMSGKRVLFIKPSTYMNKSGEAVRDAMSFYKVPVEKLIVMCDDVELAAGVVRIRRKGSDGGQKGLENIIYHLGSNEFPRIRIGVGKKPHPEMDLAAWVLSQLTPKDKEAIEGRFSDILKAVELIIEEDINEAMNLFN